MSDITTPAIKTLSPKTLVGISMKMSLAENKTFQLWNSFMQRRKEIKNRLSEDFFSIQVYDSLNYFQTFNLSAEFLKWAAVEISDESTKPAGMDILHLPEGLYAVFIHKGGPQTAHMTFQYIFQQWLPKSDYNLDHRPHFEVLGEKYKNDDPDSEEEIWIPVKAK